MLFHSPWFSLEPYAEIPLTDLLAPSAERFRDGPPPAPRPRRARASPGAASRLRHRGCLVARGRSKGGPEPGLVQAKRGPGSPALLQWHHGPSEGRHAQSLQSRLQRPPDALHWHDWLLLGAARLPALLPHLRDDCADG